MSVVCRQLWGQCICVATVVMFVVVTVDVLFITDVCCGTGTIGLYLAKVRSSLPYCSSM